MEVAAPMDVEMTVPAPKVDLSTANYDLEVRGGFPPALRFPLVVCGAHAGSPQAFHPAT
jgi:hypothetical protein